MQQPLFTHNSMIICMGFNRHNSALGLCSCGSRLLNLALTPQTYSLQVCIVESNLAASVTEAFPVLIHAQFTKAVESKQVAQQEAERARFVVMKADQVGILN